MPVPVRRQRRCSVGAPGGVVHTGAAVSAVRSDATQQVPSHGSSRNGHASNLQIRRLRQEPSGFFTMSRRTRWIAGSGTQALRRLRVFAYQALITGGRPRLPRSRVVAEWVDGREIGCLLRPPQRTGSTACGGLRPRDRFARRRTASRRSEPQSTSAGRIPVSAAENPKNGHGGPCSAEIITLGARSQALSEPHALSTAIYRLVLSSGSFTFSVSFCPSRSISTSISSPGFTSRMARM